MIDQGEWSHILTGVGVSSTAVAKWAPALESEVQYDQFSQGRRYEKGST